VTPPVPIAAAIVERHTERPGWRRDLPHVAQALEVVGQAGSRWRVPTPALVVDLDLLLDNPRATSRPPSPSSSSPAVRPSGVAVRSGGGTATVVADGDLGARRDLQPECR
jgi:hypothetical protein